MKTTSERNFDLILYQVVLINKTGLSNIPNLKRYLKMTRAAASPRRSNQGDYYLSGIYMTNIILSLLEKSNIWQLDLKQ